MIEKRAKFEVSAKGKLLFKLKRQEYWLRGFSVGGYDQWNQNWQHTWSGYFVVIKVNLVKNIKYNIGKKREKMWKQTLKD